tara:strand:+ start:442 stop:1035 length:594 start_codon:yes stop_codon:yes gene_type:complete
MKNKYFFQKYYDGISEISNFIDKKKLEKLVLSLKNLRNKKGRVFFLGVGGSAANSSHAVNDFRKLCGIECYSPVDNVSELTARINDEGWNSSFSNWLNISNLNSKDALFVFSVGGGDLEKKVSVNLIEAVKFGKKKGAKIFGVIGRKKSFVYKNGDNVILVPEINKKLRTPYTEAFQAVIWHSLVSHPLLQLNKTKW